MSKPVKEAAPGQELEMNQVVEPEGLNANAVGIVVVGGIVFIIAAMFLAVEITGLMFQEALLESSELSGYPVLEDTRTNAAEILSSYAPIDREAGIYRIPIDRAMELIIEEAQQKSAQVGGE